MFFIFASAATCSYIAICYSTTLLAQWIASYIIVVKVTFYSYYGRTYVAMQYNIYFINNIDVAITMC